MISQAERSRIYSEINTTKNRIGQIDIEIGQKKNRIQLLKGEKRELVELNRMFSRENAKQERASRRGNYICEPNYGVLNTERGMFNLQNQIDALYGEIDVLYREKSNLFALKEKLYNQLQGR